MGRFRPERMLRAAARETADVAFCMMKTDGTLDSVQLKRCMMVSFIRRVVEAKNSDSPLAWPRDSGDVISELIRLGAPVHRWTVPETPGWIPEHDVAAWDVEGVRLLIEPDDEGKGVLSIWPGHPWVDCFSIDLSMSMWTLVRIMENLYLWARGFDEIEERMEDDVRRRFIETRLLETTIRASLGNVQHQIRWYRDAAHIRVRMDDGRWFSLMVKDDEIPAVVPHIVPSLRALETVGRTLGVSFTVNKDRAHM